MYDCLAGGKKMDCERRGDTQRVILRASVGWDSDFAHVLPVRGLNSIALKTYKVVLA